MLDLLELVAAPASFDRLREQCSALRSELRAQALERENITRLESALHALEERNQSDRFQDWDEMLRHLHATAGAAGRALLDSCGRADARQCVEGRHASLTDSLFSGLVLTRWWSRVGADMREHDCVRLPGDCGITPTQLREWSAQPHNPRARRRFMDELRGLVRQTWVLLESTTPLARAVEPRMGWSIWLARRTALATLSSIHRGQYTTLWTTARASRVDVLMASVRARSGVRLGLAPPAEAPTFPV